MLKFLRKYQGWIMAVGGGLLMIAFLLPQAIQQLGRFTHNPEIAQISIDGRPHVLKMSEWQVASSQLSIAESLFGRDQVGRVLGFPIADPDEPDGPGLRGADHWYLLREHADLAGFIGGAADGRLLLEQQASLSAAQGADYDRAIQSLTDELSRAAGQANMTLQEGLEALSVLQGIVRLVSNYSGGPVVSDQRARSIVEDFQERINVSLVFVDASEMLEDEPAPDEQILEEHFQAYRDIQPGEGQQGFGYRLPDRAQVEYLRIDYASIFDDVDATMLDARKWYAQNSDLARGASGPAGAPPFDSIADDALEAYKRSLTEETMEEIGRFIKAELTRRSQGLPRDNEWRVLPDDWESQRVSFESLREMLEDQFDVEVEYTADTSRWYTMSEIGQLEGIGRGLRPVGTARFSFRQLVTSHREFDRVTTPGLQVGLADSSLLRVDAFNSTKVGPISYPQDAYLYRVVAADPARAAERLDEVREDVVRDVKRISVYERLLSEKEQWRQRALTEGLAELAESIDGRVIPGGVSRYNSATSRSGDFRPSAIGSIASETVNEAILERAEQFDPLEPMDSLGDDERLVVVGAPEALGLAIVRIEGRIPLSREAWIRVVDEGLRISGLGGRVNVTPSSVVFERDFADDDLSAFSFPAMKSRFNWIELRESSSDNADPGADGIGGQEPSETEG